MSQPIDFRVSFSGIAEASASWRTYQAALGAVVQSENQLNISQQKTAQMLTQLRSEAAATAQSFQALAPAMQAPFSGFLQSSGQATSGIRNVNAEFNAMASTVKNSGPPFANLNKHLADNAANLANVGGKAKSMGEQMQSTGRHGRALAFGLLGMTTAGAEFTGMLSMWADTNALVAERQEVVNQLTADGQQNTQEYTQAVMATEKAERFAAMTRRNLMLSMFDMIPFTVITITQLKELGFGMSTVTGLAGGLSKAFAGLSLAMKGVLISSGIGIALVAIITLMEQFGQKAEAATAPVNDVNETIAKLSIEFQGSAKDMDDAMGRLAQAISTDATKTHLALMNMIPKDSEIQQDRGFFSKLFEQAGASFGALFKDLTGPREVPRKQEPITDPKDLAIINENIEKGKDLLNILPQISAGYRAVTADSAKYAGQLGINTTLTADQNFELIGLVDALAQAIAANGANSVQTQIAAQALAAFVDKVNEEAAAVQEASNVLGEHGNVLGLSTNLMNQAVGGVQKFIDNFDIKNLVQNVAGGVDIAKAKLESMVVLLEAKGIDPLLIDAFEKMVGLQIDTWATGSAAAIEDLQKSMGDWQGTMQEVIDTMIDAPNAVDPVITQLDELATKMREGPADIAQYREGVLALLQQFNIDLPQGIKFTNDELTDIANTYAETGSSAAAMAKANDIAREKTDNLGKSLFDAQKGAELAEEGFLSQSEAVNAATVQWNDFIEGVTNAIKIDEALNAKLIEQAELVGIDLPAGLKLTNEELMKLIEAYKKTGTAAGAMAEIHNKAFADMHGIITEVVNAAVEGGKEFSNAFKEIRDAIPKDQRGFFKDFFGDLGDMQEAQTQLNQTAAALDAFLDITGGAIDEDMLGDFSKKFVKDIKELREQADDLPYVGDQLDNLLESMQNFAKNADSAEDMRIINAAIADLNEKMKDGLTSDEIEAFAASWGGFFSAFEGNPEANIIRVNNELGKLIQTAESSALEDYLTEGAIVAPTIDATANLTAIDDTGLTPDQKKLENIIAVVNAMDQTQLTPEQKTVEGSFKVTRVYAELPDPNNPFYDPNAHPDGDGIEYDPTMGKDGETETPPTEGMMLPAPDLTEFIAGMDQASQILLGFISGFNNLMAEGLIVASPNLEGFIAGMDIASQITLGFISGFNNLMGGGEEGGKGGGGLVIPSPNLEGFVTGMEIASQITLGFIEGFNNLMGGGGEGKEGEAKGGLIIPSPNLEGFIAGMDIASQITLGFIEGFNNLMGGGGGEEGDEKKAKGGLIIPAPNIEGFIEGMNIASEVALGFIETFNSAMGGGGEGDKDKKDKGGLVIPAPNIDEYIEGLNLASELANGFIETFNSAMGGGGDEEEGEGGGGGGGLIMPAPNAEAYEEGLNIGIELANQFVEDFTSGMEEAASAAEDAGSDIQDSFNNIQSAAEEAESAVSDLQNAIEDLDDKTITIRVNATGDGLKYLATGYHGVISKPTILVVGEAGPERVDVSPSNQAPTGLTSDRNVNINPVFTQQATDLKAKLGGGVSDLLEDIFGGPANGGNGRGNGRGVGQIIKRIYQSNTKVEINKRTILEIIREELLDD